MTASTRMQASYILPIRSSTTQHVSELADYLRSLAAMQIIVVDGSAPHVYEAHDRAFPKHVLHLPPDGDVPGVNGKVRGVITGLRRCRYERVIVADDDVRYTPWSLRAVVAALENADVVRPQNYFMPVPWHALLDSSRSLINRVTGGDWPGTLAFRRSFLPRGYDADTLFENLELVRTIRARGGREAVRSDIYIKRLPPTAAHYFSQRIRQAYDEFARPNRMIAALALIPLACYAIVIGQPGWIAAAAVASLLAAFGGWMHRRGYRYFSFLGVLAAPFWVAERAICSWLAVYERLRFGGVRYAGSVVRRAASSEKELYRKWAV